VALRRTSIALRHGGLRWLHVGDDDLVYVRDHPDERVLVHLSREGSAVIELDAGALMADRGTALLDHAALVAVGGVLSLPAKEGARAQIWRLELRDQ
jgi:alpha-glucosidase